MAHVVFTEQQYVHLNPPLYYMAVKIGSLFLGTSTLTMNFVLAPIILSIPTIVFIHYVWDIYGEKVALLGAFFYNFLANSPFQEVYLGFLINSFIVAHILAPVLFFEFFKGKRKLPVLIAFLLPFIHHWATIVSMIIFVPIASVIIYFDRNRIRNFLLVMSASFLSHLMMWNYYTEFLLNRIIHGFGSTEKIAEQSLTFINLLNTVFMNMVSPPLLILGGLGCLLAIIKWRSNIEWMLPVTWLVSIFILFLTIPVQSERLVKDSAFVLAILSSMSVISIRYLNFKYRTEVFYLVLGLIVLGAGFNIVTFQLNDYSHRNILNSDSIETISEFREDHPEGKILSSPRIYQYIWYSTDEKPVRTFPKNRLLKNPDLWDFWEKGNKTSLTNHGIKYIIMTKETPYHWTDQSFIDFNRQVIYNLNYTKNLNETEEITILEVT